MLYINHDINVTLIIILNTKVSGNSKIYGNSVIYVSSKIKGHTNL